MGYDIRPVSEAEYPAYTRALQSAFGNPAPGDDEIAGWLSITELDRTLAVVDGGQILGTAGALTFELTTPGRRTVAAAGVTAVGVLPTHHRRGLLTALMGRQLDDIAAAGEPVAILTASESSIYGRFGYGPATAQAAIAIDPKRSAYRTPLRDPGGIELLSADATAKLVPAVHDQARLDQPGDIMRAPSWWALMNADLAWLRPSGAKKFWALHRTAGGEPDGYVSYRVDASWPHGLPRSEVDVIFLVGLTAETELALWRFVLDLDLAGSVVARSRPVDEALRWRLADPRQLKTTAVTDDVWVRLLDVPAALVARGYETETELVIEVDDAFRPQTSGRFLLQTGMDGASCTPTDRAPDLSLGVAELGSAYLGQPRFTLLAGAGRVIEHTEGVLRRADAAFGSATIPFCRSGF